MIQRIQSLYLLGIMLIVATLCSINIIHAVQITEGMPAKEYFLNLFYFTVKQNGVVTESKLQWLLILITAIIIGLSLAALTSYKNRRKQLLYCKLNFLLFIVLLVAFTAAIYTNIPSFNSTTLSMQSGIGISLILFLFYFNWRAHALILKDEELIKSTDRIR